ncbi:MAG: hypothetical protein ACUVX9_13595 [Anaerolineae bacterium]
MAIVRFPITIDGEITDIGTAGELAVALDVLQGRHDREVLEQLRPHLAQIIGTGRGLHGTLKALAPADQEYLLRALGPELPAAIGSAAALRDILATTSEMAVEQALLETLGASGLRRLIVTAEELAEVLEWVYGECDRLALDLLGTEHLRLLIHSGHALSLVLHSLDAAVQRSLLQALGWEWLVARVRDGRDLAYLLRALPSDLGKELLAYYTPGALRALIGNERDWQFLWQRLEPDEATHLSNLLGVSGHAQ